MARMGGNVVDSKLEMFMESIWKSLISTFRMTNSGSVDYSKELK